jgi:5-methylcytosine-specific restriction endonuclease McrA
MSVQVRRRAFERKEKAMRFGEWRSAKSDLLEWAKDDGQPADVVAGLRQRDSVDLLRTLMDNERDMVVSEVAKNPGWWKDRVSLTVDAHETTFDSEEQAHLSRVGLGFQAIMRYQIESCWLQDERPYYNVYPIVLGLAEKTDLSFPLSRVKLPHQAMLFRFPAGHEPSGISAAIICTDVPNPALPGDRRHPFVALAGGLCPHSGQYTFSMSTIEDYGDPEITVAESIGRQDELNSIMPNGGPAADRVKEKLAIIFRLAVIAAQLSEGRDLITPIVLAKDRKRYEQADDAEKRWLEERAARVAGRGFDFGRELQHQSEQSPHWRNPHLALFWTGEGRTRPVLKLRAGCVVLPKHMSEVPTGLMGPETQEELDRPAAPLVYRVPVPKRLRFKILRRDKYRCRLCGLSQDDGVRLEIDHRVPVAKGGKTTPDNLWTLCHPCNNGKRDSSLHEPEADPEPAAATTESHATLTGDFDAAQR